MYSSTILEEGKTKLINNVIVEILPIIKDTLLSEDLVYSGLSFLALIIERNPAFIKYYKSEGIIALIFDLIKGIYYFIEDPNFVNNLNIIKIFIKLMESAEITFNDIINYGMIQKINTLISADSGDNEIYTEYAIELFFDLMVKINEVKKKYSKNIEIEEFKVIRFINIRNLLQKLKMSQKISTCVFDY